MSEEGDRLGWLLVVWVRVLWRGGQVPGPEDAVGGAPDAVGVRGEGVDGAVGGVGGESGPPGAGGVGGVGVPYAQLGVSRGACEDVRTGQGEGVDRRVVEGVAVLGHGVRRASSSSSCGARVVHTHGAVVEAGVEVRGVRRECVHGRRAGRGRAQRAWGTERTTATATAGARVRVDLLRSSVRFSGNGERGGRADVQREQGRR